MKKLVSILKGIFKSIFIIIIILILIFVYITKFRITDVTEFINEKNKYKILFQAVGEPEWPFGRTKVKVTLLNSNNIKIKSFKEYISNDGAIASKYNINVNWYDDYVEVILKGGEQEDDIHILKYNFWDNLINKSKKVNKKIDNNNYTATSTIVSNNDSTDNPNKNTMKEKDILYEKIFDEKNKIRIVYKGAVLGQKSIIEIEKSNDNGNTWVNQLEMYDGFLQIHNGSKFVFIDKNIGFINDPGLAGTNNEHSALLVTVDGGKTFVEANIIHPDIITEENLLVTDVPYVENDLLKIKCYAINYNKAPKETYYEFYSKDKGINWNYIEDE